MKVWGGGMRLLPWGYGTLDADEQASSTGLETVGRLLMIFMVRPGSCLPLAVDASSTAPESDELTK